MKLKDRLQVVGWMATGLGLGLASWLTLVPTSSPHTANLDQPAAATVSPSPSLSPSAVIVPTSSSPKPVRRAAVAPHEVTNSSMVPTDPIISPSPSGTPSSTPPNDGNDGTQGPIYTPPPGPSANPTPTRSLPTVGTVEPN